VPGWMKAWLIAIFVIIVAIVVFPPIGDFIQSMGTGLDDAGDKTREFFGWTGLGGASTK
jgi:phosphotransferase system  glucose/maltose/N-acetylglucosamine-specific IIC component